MTAKLCNGILTRLNPLIILYKWYCPYKDANVKSDNPEFQLAGFIF